MKNLFSIIFLLLSFSAFSQVDTVDVIGPEYPLIWKYQKDFTNEPNTSTVTAFNGGTIAYSADSLSLRVTGSSSARGAEFQYTYTGGNKYQARISLKNTGQFGVRVFSQWATLLATYTQPGVYDLSFTAPAAAGGFGRELILATNGGPDTFYVNRVDIWEENPDGLFYNINQADAAVRNSILENNSNSGVIYENDFLLDKTGVTSFTTPNPVLNTDGTVTVTAISGAPAIIAANYFRDTMSFRACLDVVSTTKPMAITPTWGANHSGARTISTPGTYCFDMERFGVVTSSLNGLTISPAVSGDTVVAVIDWVSITEIDRNARIARPQLIGNNISTPNRYTGQHIILGNNSTVTSSVEGVFLGDNYNAGGLWTRRFGASYLIDEGVGIGTRGYQAHARTTGVGSEHVVVGQSSTGIGSGAEVYTTHGFAAGRGAYLSYYPHQNDLSNFSGNQSPQIVFAEESLHLGNGWFHRSPEPVSGQSRGVRVPNTVELKIFGQDAFDARHPAWSSTKTYATNNIVFHNDSTWFALQANTNSAPTLTNTANWSFWQRDTQGAATDFNVDGGDIGVYAGRATGTGQSGSVNFYVAEGDNGPNVKDTPKKAGEYRSDDTLTSGTYYWLFDESTGTMRRVTHHQKPTQSGSGGVVGFGKLDFAN